MKQKIIVLTLCFCFLMNTISFANNDDIQTIQINNYIASNSTYNPVTNENEIIISNPNNRSATIAISTSVASTLLAIATRAGISFVNSGSMDTFLYHFVGLETATEIIGSLSSLIKNTTNGVVKLSRSLIDSITRGISQSYYKRLDKLSLPNGVTIPVVGNGNLVNNIEDRVNINLLKQSIINAPSNISLTGQKGDNLNPLSISTPNYDIKISPSSRDILFPIAEVGSDSFRGYSISFGYGTHYSSDYWKATLVAYYSGSKHYIYGAVLSWKKGETNINNYNVSTVRLSDYLTYEDCTDLIIEGTTVPDFPEAWSDTIKGDDGTTDSSISIPIPSNPNDLIGKDATSVNVTNTGYDVWTPGTTISPPTVDTPTVNYVPSDDVVVPNNPPKEDEGEGSGLWDWLKNLINSILSILQNIWNWITSFWDSFSSILRSVLSSIFDFSWLSNLINTIVKWLDSFWDSLLDFIVGLFVPSDTYWTDKVTELTSEIKNKYPTININKLKDLAVGEKKFEDVYVTVFGQECLIVRGSLVNDVIGWARPIIQGLICIFLLIFNYNQLYRILRNKSLSK